VKLRNCFELLARCRPMIVYRQNTDRLVIDVTMMTSTL